MIRKILIPVRGDGKGDNVLAHAAALARRFKAHVAVTHCRPRAEDLIPFGIPIPTFLRDQLIKQSRELADLEEAGLQAELEALAVELGLTMVDKPTSDGNANASWTEEQGKQVDVIKSHGRLADLIAVAKPDVDRNLGSNTLKAALFHTGRPVMMCPNAENIPDDLGANITIAWNGSTESARAVALTAGLLESAETVTILTTGAAANTGNSAEELAQFLALRGVTAKIDRFTPGKNIGAQLLEHSAAAGASMMIMGAYGDSHERETFFGGNTQTVVDTANFPIVFVH